VNLRNKFHCKSAETNDGGGVGLKQFKMTAYINCVCMLEVDLLTKM